LHCVFGEFIEMMDDLGLEDISFDESSAHADQKAAANTFKAPDSARVSVLPFFFSVDCNR